MRRNWTPLGISPFAGHLDCFGAAHNVELDLLANFLVEGFAAASLAGSSREPVNGHDNVRRL